jgi:hypothetical protein
VSPARGALVGVQDPPIVFEPSGRPDATIQILSARKVVLWSTHVRATTTWRYWCYHPRCRRTYYVRYRGGWGAPYTVRVRVSPARRGSRSAEPEVREGV